MHTSGYRGATAARSVPETAVRGSGAAVSASIRRRRAMGVIGRLIRTPHRRCDDAPAPATRIAPDRAQRPPKLWLRANTSRHKAMSHGRMVAEAARLERECAAIVARMEEVNAAEDTEHGEDDDGSGGLPAGLQSRGRRRGAPRGGGGPRGEGERGESEGG